VAAICALVSQITVQQLLRERVRAQVTAPLPEGKKIADYVHAVHRHVFGRGSVAIDSNVDAAVRVQRFAS